MKKEKWNASCLMAPCLLGTRFASIHRVLSVVPTASGVPPSVVPPASRVPPMYIYIYIYIIKDEQISQSRCAAHGCSVWSVWSHGLALKWSKKEKYAREHVGQKKRVSQYKFHDAFSGNSLPTGEPKCVRIMRTVHVFSLS